MDFSRRRTKVLRPEEGELAELYPHDLQIYSVPPICEISLNEFEQLANDRLRVLRIMEQISSSGQTKNLEEWKKLVSDQIKKHADLKGFHKVITSTGSKSKEPDYAARKADHISHFILRLAFCRTEELRRWLISRELDLFRLRWSQLSVDGKSEFIRINKLNYDPISVTERVEMSEKSFGMVSSGADYYRIPFIQVLDLVRSRKVFLHNGFAYITNSEIISVLLSVFRSRLSHELSRTARHLPVLEGCHEDHDRIFRPLKSLPHTHLGEDYSSKTSGGKVPIECIDSLARQSFPLCMRQLHSKLRSEHKLRHFARLQYAMFLKGIGVTLEDIMTMWREEWAKVEPEKFEKGGIAYLLRHSYGKEGKRTNYTPQSCAKIISGSVATGDQHGCPFKHNDVSSIRMILQQNNTAAADVQELVELLGRQQYTMACTKYFELTHGVMPERFVIHPNQYFEESQHVKNGTSSGKPRNTISFGGNDQPIAEKKPVSNENMWDDDDIGDDELMQIDAE